MANKILSIGIYMLLMAGNCTILAQQPFNTIQQAESKLSGVLASLNLARDDSAKSNINENFIMYLSEALKMPSSDTYPFDSLKTLIKITSPDKKFRIFHWNLPTSDGEHHYYGFIKMLDHDPPMVFPLVDLSDSLSSPETALLDDQHWFGALYYKIIREENAGGELIYTLLGWAGKNALINQKVIEVLYFDQTGRPHFGMKLFPDYVEGNLVRVIFRFAPTTSMSLKYENQSKATNKKWNSKKRLFDYTLSEAPMIVYDRLVPLDPQLEGLFQYYVPSGNIFDGFIFQDNCWKFISDVDTRNKK